MICLTVFQEIEYIENTSMDLILKQAMEINKKITKDKIRDKNFPHREIPSEFPKVLLRQLLQLMQTRFGI